MSTRDTAVQKSLRRLKQPCLSYFHAIRQGIPMAQTAVVVQGRKGLLSENVHDNIQVVKDAPIPEPSNDEALVRMLLR